MSERVKILKATVQQHVEALAGEIRAELRTIETRAHELRSELAELTGESPRKIAVKAPRSPRGASGRIRAEAYLRSVPSATASEVAEAAQIRVAAAYTYLGALVKRGAARRVGVGNYAAVSPEAAQ